jgi:RNA polymerase sigma-70 factor, ECF subfamily
MNDHELIEGLQQNRQAAFRLLLERYQELVVTTCFNFLRNSDDAHDIAQEVFIEVFKSIGKFRKDATLATWLYRVSVNKSLNHLRKHKNKPLPLDIEKINTEQTTGSNLAEPDFTQPLEREKEYIRRAMLLHQTINTLPDNQKTAFTLHKFNQMPYKEIAGVMNISLSAVEALIHRAKKSLQARLIKVFENQKE